MGIEVSVTGVGSYAGAKSNIGQYRVTEDSTPIEASDSSGGTGQIQFTAIEDPTRLGSALLLNNDIQLSDGDRGLTAGRINHVSSNNGDLDITADSRLGRLVIDTEADPVDDTFNNVIRYYLSLGGLVDDIAVDNDLSTIPVIAQGWTGDLWTKVKELLITVGAEITLIKGSIVVRPIRELRALEINNASESWSIRNVDLAKQIEVVYYNSEWKAGELVYPQGGWNEDVSIYTVDAGQTLRVNIPVNVSIVSVEQPVVQSTVAVDYGASSVYSVSGSDGNAIDPIAWTAGFGSLTVEIGEDKKSLDVTIIGASGSEVAGNAPYRIAVSTGPSEYYSSLRIVGEGLHYEPDSVIVATGVDEESTSRDVGVTVDNIFVKDIAQARDIALDVAARWAAPTRTIRMEKASINKPNDTSQNLDYATLGDFDAYAAANGIITFGDFDATDWTS